MVASNRLLVALLSIGVMSVAVDGLTVYRLGGADLPPPPEVQAGKLSSCSLIGRI